VAAISLLAIVAAVLIENNDCFAAYGQTS